MPILLQAPKTSSNLIQYISTKILIQQFRVKKIITKNKTLDNQINYTDFSFGVGQNIFMFFIGQKTLFKEFNTISKTNPKPLSENLNNFMMDFMPLLSEYRKQVKTVGDIRKVRSDAIEKLILSHLVELPNNISMTTTNNIIKLVLCYICVHLRHNKPKFEAINITFSLEIFEVYYKTSLLHLGHYFCDYFKTHSSKIFNIVKEFDQKKKT